MVASRCRRPAAAILLALLLVALAAIPSAHPFSFQAVSSRRAGLPMASPIRGSPRESFSTVAHRRDHLASARFAAPSSDELDEGPTTAPLPILDDRTASALLFLILPILSLSLPLLLNLKMYAALSVAKRAYIYLVALSIVVIGSARGGSDSPNLGERLQSLTGEILPGRDALLGLDGEESSGGAKMDDGRFEELRALDVVTPTAQSAALPVVVSVSLVLSLLLLQLQGGLDLGEIFGRGDSAAGPGADFAAFFTPIVEGLKSTLPSLVQLSNVAVIGLFVRSEVERGVRSWSNDDAGEVEENDGAPSLSSSQLVLPLSAALVSLAYLAPPSLAWPVRNLVCSCLGIGVIRAVQVPRLGPVVAALSLLVLYDVYSVGMMLVDLGSQSMAASGVVEGGNAAATVAATATAASASAGNAASSAMGAVAMSKVGGTLGDSSVWQPGLLEIRLRGRVTDLLGLGDAVFPSLLSTFALRYDQCREEGDADRPFPFYFLASLVGYGVGTVSCELAPGIGSSGLPALLFIVPAMLTSVGGLSGARGELGKMWSFNPAETAMASDR